MGAADMGAVASAAGMPQRLTLVGVPISAVEAPISRVAVTPTHRRAAMAAMPGPIMAPATWGRGTAATVAVTAATAAVTAATAAVTAATAAVMAAGTAIPPAA